MYEFFPLGASPHTQKKDEVKISKAKKKNIKEKNNDFYTSRK